MAGRTGEYDGENGIWSNVIYMPCTAENGFVPELPKETPDLIYLCIPNNPSGTTLRPIKGMGGLCQSGRRCDPL